MRFILRTVVQRSNAQGTSRDGDLYVRKPWTAFAAYYIVTSFLVGLAIGGVMPLFAATNGSRGGNHKALPLREVFFGSIIIGGLAGFISFCIQLCSGPFVFTKDVVCRKCHTRMKVDRRPFFVGRYSRPPKCVCGGKVEPACLWKAAGSIHP